MTCDEVRAKWPDEYCKAEQAIRESDDTPPGVEALKQAGTLTLEDAKRIVLAIQNEMTLEEFKAGDFPFIRQCVMQVELLW